MYLKKKIVFRVFAFRKTSKRMKMRKNVILKLHFPDDVSITKWRKGGKGTFNDF